MAAPEHVPVDRTRLLRTYESPPRRAGSWMAGRPGELPEGQPEGEQFGNQGPDQGYVLSLIRRFHGKLTLTAGEHERDALAGAAAVALKRASLFGRAPVVHDLTVALTVWGFLGDAPAEIVQLRKRLFEEVAHPHHYSEQRRIVDLVPEETLRRTPQQVTEAHRADWRSLLGELPAARALSAVERITVPVNGFQFDALSAGPVDGEPVLLLHGFPETSHSWRHQIPVLADAGYRVLAPDQRGYSPGARPADVDAYRGEHLVSDVLGFADAMGGGPVHLVGHDWGAAVAWQVAGQHQDALRTLTILSVPHPAAFGSALRGEGDQKDRSGYVQMFRAEGTEDVLVADDAQGLRFIYLGSGLSEAEAEVYVEALGTAEALGAALNWYRAASLTDVEGLGEITTPTLYVWSTEDVALGREGAEATAAFVAGPYRFVVLDGVSHWIPEHAPDRLNALLLDHLAG